MQEQRQIQFPLAVSGRALRTVVPEAYVPDDAEAEIEADGMVIIATDDRAWRLPQRLSDDQLERVRGAIARLR